MHKQAIPCCDHHYGRGGREIQLYRGPIYNQAGRGFFGDVFQKLVPLLTTKVAPYLGKRLLEAGHGVVQDIKEGQSFRSAIKKGAKRSFTQGKSDLLRKLSGGGYKRKKKTSIHQKHRTSHKRDYFSP